MSRKKSGRQPSLGIFPSNWTSPTPTHNGAERARAISNPVPAVTVATSVPEGTEDLPASPQNVAWELGEADGMWETYPASALPRHRVQHMPQCSGLSLLSPTNEQRRWTSTLVSMQAHFTGSAEATKAPQIPMVSPCPCPGL